MATRIMPPRGLNSLQPFAGMKVGSESCNALQRVRLLSNIKRVLGKSGSIALCNSASHASQADVTAWPHWCLGDRL